MRKEQVSRKPPRGLGPRQRFIILLPDHLAAQVRTLALNGRRPINTQFEMLVEQALRQDAIAPEAAEAAA